MPRRGHRAAGGPIGREGRPQRQSGKWQLEEAPASAGSGVRHSGDGESAAGAESATALSTGSSVLASSVALGELAEL